MPDKTPKSDKLTLSLDFRLISLLLLAAIAVMLFLWKPWQDGGDNNRTVQVTGEAKIKAVPDEFFFTPSYSFSSPDKAEALDQLNKKSEELVSRLKKLGVDDRKIKTNADGYQRGIYFPEQTDTGATYNLSLNVTVNDKDLAQKVQDYLVSTNPSGAVFPHAVFSASKQKELESKARDEATRNARAKAEQSARNLGYRIGRVVSVKDTENFMTSPPIRPLDSRTTELDASRSAKVQPGENELTYSVTVTYYIH